MHRGDRVAGIGQVPGTQLRGQLPEPCSEHGSVVGRKLPGQPDIGQVAVGVFHGHARFTCTSQAEQCHYSRAAILIRGQPFVQLRQQVLAPRQQRRTWRQPNRLTSRFRAPGNSQLASRHAI